MKTRILCFGDSNTWGFVPGSGERFDETVRWPKRLQAALGEEFEIIEDGLCGRAILREDPETGRHAAEPYFSQALQVHAPLDHLILALGTNDLKAKFDLAATEITAGMQKLLETAIRSRSDQGSHTVPDILVLCPPAIGPFTQERAHLFSGGARKQAQLRGLYGQLAQELAISCCQESASIAPSPVDGIHLNETGHEQMFKLVVSFFGGHDLIYRQNTVS